MVSYNTPMETIDQLRSRINTYVNANNREWSGFGLNIDKMEYQNAIHLIVAMERMFPTLQHCDVLTRLVQIGPTGKTGVVGGLDEPRSCVI